MAIFSCKKHQLRSRCLLKNAIGIFQIDKYKDSKMTKHLPTLTLVCATILSPMVYAEETIDPESLFKEAMELRESGEVFTSIEILESILSNQPGLNRARLELAVAYHRALWFKEAREQLTNVLNDPDTPDEVKLTITGYLAQLGSDEKVAAQQTSSTVYVSAGFFTDSNLNLAPSAEISGAPSTVTEQSGEGMVAMASYSHTYRSSDSLRANNKVVQFEWQSQATAYSKAYSSGNSDFNLHFLSLATGPAWISKKHWKAKLNLQVDKIYYAGEDYSLQIGLNPSFTLILDNQLEITAENRSTIREFEDSPDLEGLNKMHGIQISKYFSKRSMNIQGGIRYHSNGAEAAHLHANGAELFIGAQIPTWTNGQVLAHMSSRGYEYKAGTLGNDPRDETETHFRLGVSHKFDDGLLKSWEVNAQVNHTSNDSSDSDYDYDRNVVEMNLRTYF